MRKGRDRQITKGVAATIQLMTKGVVRPFLGLEVDAMGTHARKPGSLGGEMRMRVRGHCKDKGNHTRSNYMKACAKFDAWRKNAGVSNRIVRQDPKAAVEQWRDQLQADGYSPATIHTYVAGICCGLGIEMTGIARHGTAADKRKSIGTSERSSAARLRSSNADVVRFQEIVGGRRGALQRLTGADLVKDESGELCVRFALDKGGKTQLQRVDPAHHETVKRYFAGVAPDELVFPHQIDKDLDLHGIRGEHARQEYERYARICSTPEARDQMREQLLRRYTDPEIGCKGYLLALDKGEMDNAQKMLKGFRGEMAEGLYHLRGANREVALERGLPVQYDRLALCAVSVFALSHWRNEVTVKHYMLY